MRRSVRLVPVTLVALGLLAAVTRSSGEDPAPARFDRVKTRLALLRAMDAKIDDDAGRAHVEARRIVDEAMPLPYLGVDADPTDGGMKVTKVYPRTGAEALGLRVGDVILSVDGMATPSPQALGLAIRARNVGERLAVRFRRDGKDTEAIADLGKRPEEDEDEDEQFASATGAEPAAAFVPFESRFDADKAGSLPAGFEEVLGGHGRSPRFVVRKEGAATFLRQEDDDPTGIRFPMAWARDPAPADVVVRVRLRLAGGAQDKAAGIVVRGQDRWTYLVARVNAVEGDLRIFRSAHGLRRTLPGARAEVAVADGAWHELEVRSEGPKITATLDGKSTVTGYDTYVRGRRVGLWTKSDAVSDFDDFRAESLPGPPPR